MSDELRLEIDRHNLEEEWEGHPQMYHAWAKKVAGYQATYDHAKSRLSVVAAELDRDIRNDPSLFGVPQKLTETVIYNTVILQPEHKKATKELHEASHNLGIAKAAVDALEHRKRALTLLVELWIRDYYSKPSLRNALAPDDEEPDKENTRTRGRRRLERERDNDE